MGLAVESEFWYEEKERNPSSGVHIVTFAVADRLATIGAEEEPWDPC